MISGLAGNRHSRDANLELLSFDLANRIPFCARRTENIKN